MNNSQLLELLAILYGKDNPAIVMAELMIDMGLNVDFEIVRDQAEHCNELVNDDGTECNA